MCFTPSQYSGTHSNKLSVLNSLREEQKFRFSNHLAETVVTVVDIAFVRRRSSSETQPVRAFKNFVWHVVSQVQAEISVLLVALVYVHRAEPHLHLDTDELAFERLFLGALITARAFTTDGHPTSQFWADATNVYGRGVVFETVDINEIIAQFPQVIGWHLGLTEEDITEHYETIASVFSEDDVYKKYWRTRQGLYKRGPRNSHPEGHPFQPRPCSGPIRTHTARNVIHQHTPWPQVDAPDMGPVVPPSHPYQHVRGNRHETRSKSRDHHSKPV